MCELLPTCPSIMLSWHAQQRSRLSIMSHRFSYISVVAHEPLKECRNIVWLSVGCLLFGCVAGCLLVTITLSSFCHYFTHPFFAPPCFRGHHHPVYHMPFFMKVTPRMCIKCSCIVQITPQLCSSCPLYQDVSCKLLMRNRYTSKACFTSFAEVGFRQELCSNL